MAPQIRIVLVMGVTGVGKSTFIKHATGQDVTVGDGLSSCTAKVSFHEIPGANVYLMDTPGFDDTNISDANILKEIAEALIAAFNNKAEIQGALYVHPVTETRMRGSGRQNLIMFKKVLGMRGMSHCRLVTTKWSLQDRAVSLAREKELCEEAKFWQPLIAAGAKTVRFEDNMMSAIDIIRPLLDGRPFEPQLVKEVVRDGKTLPQTAAGQVVNDDIAEARKAHAEDVAQLKADIKEAEKKKDFEFAKILREEREEHKRKIAKLEESARTLAQPVEQSSAGTRFWKFAAKAGVIVAGSVTTLMSNGILAPAAYLMYRAVQEAVGDEKKR